MTIYSFLVVCLHTYVHDLDMLLHLLFLLLFFCIILSILLLFLVFNLPYISFLLNFGANTIWYLHSHLVCAKLSAYGLFIRPTLLSFLIFKPSNFKYYTMLRVGIFCPSLQNYKFFVSPSITGGFL